MKCWNCQHENTAEAKFCEECAAPLLRLCANCRCQVSSTAKFCPQCGNSLIRAAGDPRFASPKVYTPRHLADKILTSRAALAGERKHITVLFADIKGSMELIAYRDPEDARKLLHGVLERMIEAVHHYEGTVNQVMGDGILALFGAPLAHEDHAVRACYAALRMQETVTRYADDVQRLHGVPVTIRMGLNSGEIVVSAIDSDLHMEYSVVGSTVHLAARMEQMAKPGSILATAHTVKLAEGYVTARPLGGVEVKGLAEPVQVHELTGAGAARTRLQAAAGRGLTRFIDRDVERAQLRRAKQGASGGQAQLIALVGEAGVGKSRLVHEFVHSSQMAGWLVLESHSVPFGRATAYLPVIELLRNYFKINVNDSARSVREKVTGKILTLDPLLQDVIPPVLDLLDALDDEHGFRSIDPLQRRQQTCQSVIRLLLSEARVQPVLAVFEDLHWNDSLTTGLLDELVVAAKDARFILLVSYRPDYKDEWRNRPNYCRLRLDPLAGDNLLELLEAVGCSHPSLQNLKAFLMERANGNPFFVEEIVQTLVDTRALEGSRGSYRLARPLSTIEVPPTVQAVIAARIDMLPPIGKRLLQEAAVIGNDIPFALLHAISGLSENELRSELDNLEAAEFLYTSQLFPDLQYSFKHSLTHEVAYRGMLHENRRDIHARVVEVIETLYADRLGEQAERLAHHAVQGALREKSVHYLRQAGAKAVARSALVDARGCFEQALDILKELPESRATLEQAFEIRLELRTVLRQLGEVRQMLEHLRAAELLADRLKDDVRRSRVCSFLTVVLCNLDELDEALATGTRSVEIADRVGDPKLSIVTMSNLCEPYFYRGDYERVVEIAIKNLAGLPSEWANEYFGMAVPASVFTRGWLIMSLAELGRLAEAAEHEAESIRLAAAIKHTHTIGWAHLTASKLHLFKGDWVRAHLLVEHWINMSGTLDVAVLLPWAVPTSAWALAQIGELSEASRRVQQGEQLLEGQAARGIVAHRAWGYLAVSRACLLLGRLEDARRLADRSLESARHQPGSKAHALRLLGDLASHPDQFDAERGTVHYREALAIAERHRMRPLLAHSHLGFGRLLQRSGQAEQAREHLITATTMFREMEMAFLPDQTEMESADSYPAVRDRATQDASAGNIASARV
jgi:class 3 adenylate cyclase/tetratricopeptide (TPR) repeat protein